MTLNIEYELEVDLGVDYEKIIRDVAAQRWNLRLPI